MYPPQDIDLTKSDLNLLVVFDVLMRERSVTRAAHALNRTSSAVSHSLARLRVLVGDPLLVRRGTAMEATPRAEALWAGVKEVLRTTRDLLRYSSDFDPGSSAIVVRFAMPDVHPLLYARVFAGLRAAAPEAALVWRPVHDSTLVELAEGDLDLAVLPRPLHFIDGVSSTPLFDLTWNCAMRADHPAAGNWSAEAYASWPHLSVQTGDRLNAPVLEKSHRDQLGRRIALVVPEFAAVADILASSDLIATMPRMMLLGMAESHRLVLREVPFALPDLRIEMYQSTKTKSDVGLAWAASNITQSILALFKETCDHFGEGWPSGKSRLAK